MPAWPLLEGVPGCLGAGMGLWEMPVSQPGALGQLDAAQDQGWAQLGTHSPCIAVTPTSSTADPISSAPALPRQGGPKSASTTWDGAWT